MALRLLFLYWKWESVPRKKRKKNEQIKKKEEKEGEILYMCCLAGCIFSSLAPVFSGAPLLNVALVPWLTAHD